MYGFIRIKYLTDTLHHIQTGKHATWKGHSPVCLTVTVQPQVFSSNRSFRYKVSHIFLMNSAEFGIGHSAVWYSILHLHCTAAHHRKNRAMDRAKGQLIYVANEGDMGGKVTYNNGPNPILISLDHQAQQVVVNYTRHQCALGPSSFRSRPNSGKEGV